MVLLVLAVLYLFFQQRYISFTSKEDLQGLIKEARDVSRSLEEIMNTAVEFTGTMVDDLGKRMETFKKPDAEVGPDNAVINQFYNELYHQYYQHLPENPPLQSPLESEQDNAVIPINSTNDSEFVDYRAMHPYMAVRVLFEKGMSTKDIARYLERGQGEVELLLNLSKKRRLV